MSQTPHPACSYFPILPRPSRSRILLISSNLESSVCCLFLMLCLLSCPFCAGFSSALSNISFLCTLLFPLPFCCLPGSLLCSCPPCRISQPGGMCWRSKLYTIKLLVVFHNNEVSLKPFSADVAVFPQNSIF